MKILVDVGHPKQVNMLKNIIWNLEKKGHVVKITAADKENILQKLDAYGFSYESRKHYKGLVNKAIGMLRTDFWLYGIAKQFQPDIFLSYTSPYQAHVSKLLRKPYIAFTDVEGDSAARALMLSFTDVVLVPSCFSRDLGSKEVRFNSYFELAYLHPDYFTPNPAVLEELNLSINDNDKYILMKISSLDASHDIGAKGLNFRSTKEILEFIKKLETYGRVFLESEISLSSELDRYMLRIPINDFHDCISFAAMYIGDGASMAAEAAVLGVPSIYVTNTRRWGFANDLEKRYGLVHTFTNREQALEKALELLEDDDLKNKWRKRREKVLNEKVDVVKFMTEFIENYPESFHEYKKARDQQKIL